MIDYIMLKFIYIMSLCRNGAVLAYSNKLFTITKLSVTHDGDMCFRNRAVSDQNVPEEIVDVTSSWQSNFMADKEEFENDPYDNFHDIVYKYLFGDNYNKYKDMAQKSRNKNMSEPEKQNYLHFPTGRALRKAELFNDKSGVHMPVVEMMHRGHCVLNVTKDYMQTAVDTFAIFVKGDLMDIQRLPADYVLNSARTISMLKISHEKLAVTWNIVKGTNNPVHVTYETLEKYRPLFKYLSGKDMARLNLTDHRILNYIGTHPDLNRHQVGMVASKYIKMNKNWLEPKYLNLMNNLLCGVPITFMREIPENTYLQLSHQALRMGGEYCLQDDSKIAQWSLLVSDLLQLNNFVFYHTTACDPIQRKFYLGMMTRTQALGKSYSWNAQDVSRLGLLLAEVERGDLGSIKPEALAGLTAQVMSAMRPENLQYLTEIQIRHLKRKPFNILSKKLKMYKDQFISAGLIHKAECVMFLKIVIFFIIAY